MDRFGDGSVHIMLRNYLARGFALMPVEYKGKRPLIKWKEFQLKCPTSEQIELWFSNENGGMRQRNVGIITGHGGLTVLDFDTITAYGLWQHWTAQRQAAHLVATRSYRVRTARGMHVYMRLPVAVRTRVLRGRGMDIKSQGGYVLAPPSIHPTGVEYVAMNPDAPILGVSALSDILPAEMLIEDTRQNSDVQLPQVKVSSDPWSVAAAPQRANGGAVEAIKSKFRLEDFFPFRAAGRDGYEMVRCPLHDDRTPSMWVHIEHQRCGCFAGCTDKSLDVIGLYARLHDLSNAEAIRILGSTL